MPLFSRGRKYWASIRKKALFMETIAEVPSKTTYVKITKLPTTGTILEENKHVKPAYDPQVLKHAIMLTRSGFSGSDTGVFVLNNDSGNRIYIDELVNNTVVNSYFIKTSYHDIGDYEAVDVKHVYNHFLTITHDDDYVYYLQTLREDYEDLLSTEIYEGSIGLYQYWDEEIEDFSSLGSISIVRSDVDLDNERLYSLVVLDKGIVINVLGDISSIYGFSDPSWWYTLIDNVLDITFKYYNNALYGAYRVSTDLYIFKIDLSNMSLTVRKFVPGSPSVGDFEIAYMETHVVNGNILLNIAYRPSPTSSILSRLVLFDTNLNYIKSSNTIGLRLSIVNNKPVFMATYGFSDRTPYVGYLDSVDNLFDEDYVIFVMLIDNPDNNMVYCTPLGVYPDDKYYYLCVDGNDFYYIVSTEDLYNSGCSYIKPGFDYQIQEATDSFDTATNITVYDESWGDADMVSGEVVEDADLWHSSFETTRLC